MSIGTRNPKTTVLASCLASWLACVLGVESAQVANLAIVLAHKTEQSQS